MNKLIYKKILNDFLVFFLITLVASSIIVWVFQAVSFLDIMIEDGRGYLTYINYSLLNIPKIISKLLPFILFFSFFYILNKNEDNNELLIFWNFGIDKIQIVYLFFYFSIFLMIFQIILTTLVVPNALQYSRNLIKNSKVNIFQGFIKSNKFNDIIKGLTIYAEDQLDDGNFSNIYIKKDIEKNSFQITYANKGILKIKPNNILKLYNGETINSLNGKITKFKFERSDFNLNNMQTDIIEVNKIQETTSLVLFACLNKLFKKNINFLESVKLLNSSHNCKIDNVQNVYRELYKRFIVPLYIPILFLITLFLILSSKEKKNFKKLKVIIFLINFLIIIWSETSLKFIGNSFHENYFLVIMPFLAIIILIINFIYQLKIKYRKIITQQI
jgi:lipopolysaccharide export system permease protein